MFINAEQCISEHWELICFPVIFSVAFLTVVPGPGFCRYLREGIIKEMHWSVGHWLGRSVLVWGTTLPRMVGYWDHRVLPADAWHPPLSRPSFPEGGWSDTWVWMAVAILHCTPHRIFSWAQSVKHHHFRITALHLSSLEWCMISGVLDKEIIFHVSSVAN